MSLDHSLPALEVFGRAVTVPDHVVGSREHAGVMRNSMPWCPCTHPGTRQGVDAASRNSAYESSIATASRATSGSASGSVQSPIPTIPAQEIAEIRSAW